VAHRLVAGATRVRAAPIAARPLNSGDIKTIFCDACDLLGLRWTIAPNTVYVSRKADVALLDQFVGPKR
jgi:hypothetical protein